MLQVKSFTFNLYQENTFVLSDETGEGVVIDPGCYSQAGRKDFILNILRVKELS